MSHELRTPLNLLLILSKRCRNAQVNLTEKQVEFAKNIHDAGADLLGLINDIRALSKIESGTVTLDVSEMSFAQLRDQMDRNFRHLAQEKKIDFTIDIDAELPRTMYTDEKRLQQIIKNLLSNAFKFTEQGGISFAMSKAEGGWTSDHLTKSGQVLAFSVTDTVIGTQRTSSADLRGVPQATAPPAASTAHRRPVDRSRSLAAGRDPGASAPGVAHLHSHLPLTDTRRRSRSPSGLRPA